MKIIIFAGGQGKRLWPLSRKKSPKQFKKIFLNETSLENSYSTIKNFFNVEDIFISTGANFVNEVFKTIPNLPKDNLILEPESRDTAAAVGYAMLKIMLRFPNEPVVIRWQNSLIKNPEIFTKALQKADQIFRNKEAELVYLGVPSKYPNPDLGHIQLGNLLEENEDTKIFEFKGFKEKPDLETSKKYHEDGSFAWNPGCYISTPSYLLKQFETFAPKYYEILNNIKIALKESNVNKVNELFLQFEKKSIDYIIWEKIPADGIKVVISDYGWNYVSTWKDLRNALQSNQFENVTLGEVKVLDSKNNLIFNYNKNKIVTLIGIEDIEIIDTKDALLIVKSSEASKVKNLVEELEDKYL